MLKRILKGGLRKAATLLAATATLGLGFSGPAHAFSYTTGDLVGIVVENNTELIVNLGKPASFTSPATFNMPSQWANTLGTGKFIALTVPNNADPLGDVTFTAGSGVNVPSFDNPVGTMAGPIIGSFQALDQPSNDKWLNRLNGVPAPDGTNIFLNQLKQLVVSGGFSNGYTQSLDFGTDAINNNMPFSTALKFNGGTTASGNLWQTGIDSNTLGGIFANLGAISAHDNGNGTVTIALVPEPGTALLMGSGLLVLAVTGRRKSRAV